MDTDHLRFATGLALESAIVHGRETEALLSLYSDPEPESARELHDGLAASDHQHDREAAIWLETGLDTQAEAPDPRGLVAEMREMEVLLLVLIRKVGKTQRELNLWMDYIANAGQFLLDGLWIDAKIMLNRAVDCSKRGPVEALRSRPDLGYQLDVMQRATASYFEEVKGYSIGLQFPRERLGEILGVQRALLELMMDRYRDAGEDGDLARRAARQLSSALRHLMEGRKGKAEKELTLALRNIRAREGQVCLGFYARKLGEALEALEE
ncbi:MAG: hypothetical protein JSV18_02225 [Candidatus Bathyarchaeota archaeon]|nr:MAG: hypothetical protein JSV18_02225 [Candidatus Bathyarchaeota archaeon]